MKEKCCFLEDSVHHGMEKAKSQQGRYGVAAVVAVCLCVAGLIGVLIYQSGFPPISNKDTHGSVAEAPSANPEPRPSDPTPLEQGRSTPNANESQREYAASPAAESPAPQLIVTGHLAASPSAYWPEAIVTVEIEGYAPFDGRSVRTDSTERGTFIVDIGPEVFTQSSGAHTVEDARRVVQGFIVTTEHPSLLTSRITLPAEPWPVADDVVGSPAYTWDAGLISLVYAAAMRGVVVVPVGYERKDVPVGLFSMEGERPAAMPIMTVYTDDRGRFAVKTDHNGPVVVLASLPNLAPGFARHKLTIGEVCDADPLLLSEGATISGIAQLPEAVDDGSAVVSVELGEGSLKPDDVPLHFQGDMIALSTDRARIWRRKARLGSDRRFWIAGLDATYYVLDVEWGAGTRFSFPSWPTDPLITLLAPAMEINVPPTKTMITIQVKSQSQPIEALPEGMRGSIQITRSKSSNEEGQSITLDMGRAAQLSFNAPPSASFHARLIIGDAARDEVSFVTPSAGKVETVFLSLD